MSLENTTHRKISKILPDLIEFHAANAPETTALIYQNQSLSYRELNRRSSILAKYLQEKGVKKGDFVAIVLPRSLDLLISIIAIQKAGAAYLPIDIAYPKERISFMIADSAAKAILTTQKSLPLIVGNSSATICLDAEWDDILKSTTNHYNKVSSPTDLAYMIYTSGSTGKPKGVLISHENVFHQLEGQQTIAPAPIQKMLLTCSISFDVSVLTIFWTFYQGATLVVPLQDEEKDISQLASTIERHKVSHILTLPSLLTLLLEQADPLRLQSLELINVSGEVCPTALAQRHESLLPNCQLYNLYGPTEATVNCTYFKIPKDFSESKVPIGVPIKNYMIFILNEKLEEVSEGEVGEIYIGGSKEVVGLGYYNRPNLSAERFIANPFALVKGGSTLYKTGDLARWMPDGNIEFLGRSDFQIKLNGYRIELGEIESVISQHEAVKENVVIFKNNDKRLIAYLTTQQGVEVTISTIRDFLSERLPAYMLPTTFIFLEKMPLTPNGKFDRKALPEPSGQRPNLAQSYQAPQTSIEIELTQKWESLLGIVPIGRNDKFFELGGTSILAAQFIGQLQKELDTSIFVTAIFDNPTIASFAKMLEQDYARELNEKEVISEKIMKSRAGRLTENQIKAFDNYIPKFTHLSNNTNKNPRAIFIVAPPRSGTSLLSLLLNEHPSFISFNELNLMGFSTLDERANAFDKRFSLWKEGAIQAVMRLQNCDVETAKALIQNLTHEEISTKDFYKKLQQWATPKTIIDKTPAYALDASILQKINEDFESPFFIHLMRHPFSMVQSFEKYHLNQVLHLKTHPYNAKQLAELVWLYSHRNITTFLEGIPTNQKFHIKYEDLVQRPEEILRKLYQQLGQPFHKNLLNSYEDIKQKGLQGIYEVSRSMSDSNMLKFKQINAAKATDWKGVFTNNFLSEQTIDLAKKLGYHQWTNNGNNSSTTNQGLVDAQNSFEKSDEITSTDIAIVGMACRVAGAENLHEFWMNLVSGADVSQEVQIEDLKKYGLALKEDSSHISRAFTLKNIDCFDAPFFGYHPKEAALMDPQHRILLEVAYAALESAGYNSQQYEGNIGIYGGIAQNTYFNENIATHPDLLKAASEYSEMLVNEKSFAISRVAYKLNLKGPAVNVQTACSTSGTAIHLACQSILNGDANMTLVAGGRIHANLNAGYDYTEGGPLSPDGYIRAFDADAKGMVKGNGMLCIVLKKLDKAQADNDHIWAVIKSTAINNDGLDKIGFTAPSSKGQAKAISKALSKAGLKGDDIDYIEAHGTGTILGDPIEIGGLSEAFRQTTSRKQFCGIGSVKTAIGHLDAGACLAGIIKTALALKYELLPPTLNYENPNPQINFEQSPFYVVDKLKPWKKGDRIRRAGVSSFGLGGTNAHIILEEVGSRQSAEENRGLGQENDDKGKEQLTASPDSHLLLLSAKKEGILAIQETNLKALLERKSDVSLTDVAYTLAVGRASFQHRKAIIKGNKDTIVTGQRTEPRTVTFLFPGGGAQYVGMAGQLYTTFPYFREQVDYCVQFLKEDAQLNIQPFLFPTQALSHLEEEIKKPTYALATLFTIEYALARLWQHWGVQPSRLIGHSMGEYTAACIAGVFSVEDAIRLIVKRGQLFERLPQKGGMIRVALSAMEVSDFLIPNTSISVINRKDSCVISGKIEAIEKLENTLIANEIEVVRIPIQVAAHSALIEPIIPEFKAFLKTISFEKPKLPIISNIDGKWADETAITTPEYWVKHLRQTVHFADGLSTILETNYGVLLEVGPGQSISTIARQHSAKTKQHLVLPSVRHPKENISDVFFIHKTLAKLWCNGLEIDWQHYYKPFTPVRTPLPTYPFERKRYWIEPASSDNKNTLPVKNIISQKSNNAKQVIEKNKAPLNSNILNRKDYLSSLVKDILYELSGMPPEEMENEATFLELGFDSLFLTQAVTQFNRKFKLAISFRQLFEDTPTIDALAIYLDDKLSKELFLPSPPPSKAILENKPSLSMPSSGNVSSELQQIVQQQLHLMQQQLDMLKGVGSISKNELSSSNHLSAKEEIEQKITSLPPKKKDTEKGFGPWKPIPKEKQKLSKNQEIQLKDFIGKYNQKTKGSKELSQEQRRYLADPRSIQAFNKLWKDAIYQIAMVRSKGSKMWDVDGNEYIDFLMSFGIGLFGHTPDFIQAAVIDQMKKGTELAALPPLAKEVAQLVCEITDMERATLVNTGSEAVSAAIRAARTVTGKEKIAVFEGDYHGITDEVLVRGIQIKGRTKPVTIAPGIPNLAVANVLVLYYDDPNLETVIRENATNLAAIIVEPIHTQTPHLQRKSVIKTVRQLCTTENVALIYDELVTGFRLTQRGAQGWYGIEADICAYGKIASGGLPIAMVAGKAKYLDAFDGGYWQYGDASFPEAMVTFFGGTFVKHPVSLAAAKAVLKKIKAEGWQLQINLNQKAKAFAGKLKELFLKTKAPLAVKSASSIISIKVIDQFPLSNLFFLMMRYKGVYMTERAGFISTEHTDEDLVKVLSIYESAIEEMFDRQFFEPWQGGDLNEIIDTEKMGLALDPFQPKEIELTDGQEEIWIGHQFSPQAAAAYNLATEIELKGDFSLEKMKIAIQQLVKRHESLRTTFNQTGTRQIIYPSIEIDIPFIDLSIPSSKIDLDEIRRKETKNPMDLFQGPLCHFKIIRLTPQKHIVTIMVHHIIADGWSLGILSQDLGELYAQAVGRKHKNLAPPKQLSDYVSDHIISKKSIAWQKAAEYWYNEYKEDVPVLAFPTDFPRPPVKTHSADLEKIYFSEEIHQRIKKLAIKQGTSFYNFMFAAFQVYIYRLSQQNKFSLGVVAAGQAIAGNQSLVGHSVSLLPLKMQLDKQDSFNEHLKKVRSKILDAFEHQQYTLGALVKQLTLERDASRQALVSILFNLDNDFNQLNFGELEVTTRAIPRHFETYDIFINLKPSADGIFLEWIYNTDLFKTETIQRRLEEFKTFTEHILDNPDLSISQLSVLPDKQKKLLTSWNATNVDNHQSSNIYDLFAQQSEQTPGKIALIFDNQFFTYKKLLNKVNDFSTFLQQKGINKGKKVGVYMDRSAEMLITLLAILRLGAIYIPLDSINPKERLQSILKDVAADFLISHNALKDRLLAFTGLTLFYEKGKNYSLSINNQTTLDRTDSDLAYIIYTSGSTGKPKGIAITHYAVIDHHLAIIDKFGINQDDKVLAVASIMFDPSVQDFFMPLFVGGQVIIASKEAVRDGFLLKDLLHTHRPTIMQATPSTWQMLLLSGWKGQEELKVLSGGEGLSRELAQQLLVGNKELWNIYGPTETTIWSTTKKIEPSLLEDRSFSYLPIGKPINNVKIYILDGQMQPVPIGISGEIYIAGPGVAPIGYYGMEALTAKTFIRNPFDVDKKYNRLYRTGDRGRFLSNGDIEYLNRGDKQVKVRGYRVELGDIENTISQFQAVKDNRVVLREDLTGSKQLVAYIISESKDTFDTKLLKEYLSELLPSYMIPAAFVLLDKFPMTTSLKVDRNKLPVPNWSKKKEKKLSRSTISLTEKKLLDIWKEVLHLNQIDLHDDFFEIGGHSLIAIQLMSKIKSILGITLPLATLLQHSTIHQLAILIDQKMPNLFGSSLIPIKPSGQNPPLFLVHGGGLHVLMYQTLSAHMDAAQPIYALQAKGLNGEAEPLNRIEDMAKHYIEEIQKISPDGPYALAGYSFGGLIAFEMAKQLRATGKEILMLGVFDTVIKPQLTRETDSFSEKITKVSKKIAWNIKDIAHNPSQNINYRKFVYQRRFKNWKTKLLHNKKKTTIENSSHLESVISKSNFEAWSNYKITPYKGDLYLFKAKEQRFFIEEKDFFGWQPYINGEIYIHEVPGDHLNLFSPPNGEVFAKILQQLLNDIFLRKE